MNEDECDFFDPACNLGKVASSAVGDAIQNFAAAVMEMVGSAVAALGTVWLSIGTPNLTNGSGGSSIPAGATPPGSGGVVTALGYVTWIGLAIAAVSVVWLGVLVSASLRRGEGALNVGRLGLVLGGVVLIAGAGSLVAGLLPAGPRGVGGATLFIQSGLWWYMAALAVLSVIIAGIRMVWENRADSGKDLIKSLFTLLVVAGAGVTFTQLFITASDTFAVWLLQGSLKCDVSSDKACFGKNITTLLALNANPATGGLGAMLVIVLGIIASLAAFLQIVLMVARSGMLVILAGILPLSAAATNTEMGKNWFRRCIGWLLAFILYKPAAAVVYAAAFQLVGTNIFADQDALVSILTGLMLMILAVLALPALMRFVTPLVGSLASGAAGGALAAGAMAALPTGAAQLGRLVGGGGSNASSSPSGSTQTAGRVGGGPGSGGPSGPGAPSGADGSGPGGSNGSAGPGSGRGPQGSSGPGSSNGVNGSSGSNGSNGATGAGGSNGAAAPAGGGTQAAAQAAQGGATAGGAAGGTAGGAAGGAAAGGAAAGAAAGPIGMAAAEGAARVGQAGQTAANAARGAAQDVTGEGEPSGNG